VITEYFVDGTQPVETCQLHGGGSGAQVAGWDTGTPDNNNSAPRRVAARQQQASNGTGSGSPAPVQQQQPQKKGLFNRLRDLFR
jgi:hypothetical protein